jgi:fatty acid/phospholipid biosynthesis enzyme
MIAHGSAVGRTITNAIRRGQEFVRSGVNQAITETLASIGQDSPESTPAREMKT